MKNLLSQKSLDIVAIAESARDDDHPVIELHPDYKWIGKNRHSGKGGGIGFMCNSNKISIIDENLLNSMTDTFERLWISVKG